MHRVLRVAVLAAFVSSASGPAAGAPDPGDCRVGFGSGATLLFPYFEVDLANPFNVTTLISISSVDSSDSYVARVVMWTDWAVPTLAFDLWLEPAWTQTINLRDVFNGVIPSTGERAAEDGRLAGVKDCASLTPVHPNPALSAEQVTQLAAYHTGVGGPLDPRCAGAAHGDRVARGYITVDVVQKCSGIELVDPVFTPANTTYPYFDDDGGFSGGIAVSVNVLGGDVVYIDAANDSAQGSEAVAISASPNHSSSLKIYTFYGRYSGWDTRDDRAPLSTDWESRFLNGGPFAGGADVIVWRDTRQPGQPMPCGRQPGWSPLHDFTTAVSERSEGYELPGDNHFPLATQRVAVSSLGLPFAFGKLIISWKRDPTQMWVVTTLKAGGFSAAWTGRAHQTLCGFLAGSP